MFALPSVWWFFYAVQLKCWSDSTFRTGQARGRDSSHQPKRMGKALWFPKLSPTNPAVVKWPASMCQTNWRPAQRNQLGTEVTSLSFWKELSAKLREAELENIWLRHICAHKHTHTCIHSNSQRSANTAFAQSTLKLNSGDHSGFVSTSHLWSNSRLYLVNPLHLPSCLYSRAEPNELDVMQCLTLWSIK